MELRRDRSVEIHESPPKEEVAQVIITREVPQGGPEREREVEM